MTSNPFEIYDTWATVYKYRAFNRYSVSILEDYELYFASPKQLNDPHDSQINVVEALKEAVFNFDTNKAPLDRKETITKVAEELKKDSSIAGKIQEIIDKQSICSFSTLPDNSLMWAHYADSHRGFCLGFDPKFIEEHIKGGFDNIIPSAVTYTDGNPFISTLDKFINSIYSSFPPRKSPSTKSFYNMVATDAVSTKALSWSYEKEFRFIRIDGGSGVVKFTSDALTEVIFGCNMSNENREAILDLLKEKKMKNVWVREIVKSSTSYSFKIAEI